MNENESRVVVSGVDIPFGDLVGLLIKLAFAAIPAAIIISMIGFMVSGVLAAIFGGLGMLAR